MIMIRMHVLGSRMHAFLLGVRWISLVGEDAGIEVLLVVRLIPMLI